MSMLRLIPIAAAALLGGCVTGYTYHSAAGGDYYSGDPHVEYRYISPGYIGYGYSPYPYGYWGGYRGYYGGYGGYGYGGGWYGPGYWYDPWYGYYNRGPYKPHHPHHRPPPPYTPPPVVTPGGDGGNVYVPRDRSGPPRDDNGFERPGRRYGNPPPVERPVVRMRTTGGLPPSQVRRPATPSVQAPSRGQPSSGVSQQRPPTTYRPVTPAPSYRPPAAPISTPRVKTTTSTTQRAVDRASARNGSEDTP